MKRMVDDKEIREFDDRITALEEGGTGGSYTAGNGININNNEISVDTDTIATISALQSFTQSFGGELTAIYSGTSTVGKARQDALGRTIDEYYASKNETLIKDEDGNVNEPLYIDYISSPTGEDADNKGEIHLGSGTRTGSVTIEAGGEESGSSIYLRGTTSVGSEGLVTISGETTFETSNRINVTDGTNTEQIAYLSDTSGTNNGVDWTSITIGNDTYDIPSATTGSHLFRHNIQLSGTTSNNQGYIVYFDIYNNDNTTYTSLADVLDALNDGSTGFTGDRITCNGLIAAGASTQYRPLFIRKDANDSSWLDAVYYYYSNTSLTFNYIAIADSQTGFSITDTIAKVY